MEDVEKNLRSTLELLAVSQTEFVSEWDAQTADRAFQWARYCEQIYTRFHSHASIRARLEDCLRLTNEQLSDTLSGYQSLSLADLAQCRHRLLVSLLRNPAAPYSVIKSLFDKFRLFEHDGGTKQGDESDLDLASLIRFKSACTMLGSFPLNLKDTPGVAVGTQVQGLMLLQRIHAIQRHPGNNIYLNALLDAVLQDSGNSGHFSEVLAAALLIEDSTNEETKAPDILIDWLQDHHAVLHCMCQTLPLKLCSRLSQQWPKFRLLYWDILKKWASSLEYDVNAGVWVQQCTSAVSFKTLVDHYKSLWSSGSPITQETEKELALLKQADGDFEVRGLSVWTDLLNELK